MNKTHELSIAVEIYKALILCITETHLSNEIKDAEIQLNNYQIFRQDRKSGKSCGGSCIFVHKTIEAEYLKDFSAPDSVGISVKLHNQCIKIVCVYRSQNLSPTERLDLLHSIKSLKVETNEELHIYGDFNLPNVSWDTLTVNCPVNTINPFYTVQRDFLETLIETGLTPVIKDGTITRRRVVGDTLQESLLDQVLVSNPNTVENVAPLSHLGKSAPGFPLG